MLYFTCISRTSSHNWMLCQWAWCIRLSQYSLLRQWATTPVHKFYLWNHRVSPQCHTFGYAGYHKMLGRFLGINTTTDKMFHQVIEESQHYRNVRWDKWGWKRRDEENACGPTGKLETSCHYVRWLLAHSWLLFTECNICDMKLAHWCLALVRSCLHERLWPNSVWWSVSRYSQICWRLPGWCTVSTSQRRLPHWDQLAGSGLLVGEVIPNCLFIYY